MTTMAQAINDCLENADQPLNADEIRSYIKQNYGDKWKPNTLTAHLYGCTVNNPKSYIHHPNAKKFLYKRGDGRFELYDEVKHGPNEWVPEEEDEDDLISSNVAPAFAEATISMEKDIEEHLVNNMSSIEQNLKLVQRQYETDIGRVDILAQDANNNPVIIEIKGGEAKDSSIGQIARYVGWYWHSKKQYPRSILIASGFPKGVRYAAQTISDLKLLSYTVQFGFSQEKLE